MAAENAQISAKSAIILHVDALFEKLQEEREQVSSSIAEAEMEVALAEVEVARAEAKLAQIR